jgi:hypothetical protein
VLALGASCDCSDRRQPPGGAGPGGGASPHPHLSVADERIVGPSAEERLEPRFGRGERLAFAFALRLAVPPVAARLRAETADGKVVLREDGVRVERGTAPNAPSFIPFALPADASQGAYRVVAEIVDGRGARATVETRLHLVSERAAASLPTPRLRDGVRRLTVRDAAGLPRTRYARGERFTVEAEVATPHSGDTAHLTLTGPEGVLLTQDLPLKATPGVAATVRAIVQSPPYGAAGAYRLGVTVRRGAAEVGSADVDLTLEGRALGRPAGLVIEASEVAGATGRRVARVLPPQIPISVRLAGFHVSTKPTGTEVAVAALAVLRTADGRALTRPQVFASRAEVLAHSPTRLELEGTLELRRPPRPGDYVLELTAEDRLAGASATMLRHVTIE